MANKKTGRFPSEESSRRIGWTEGPGITLEGGETWHLPRIDEALIPHLGKLVPNAVSLTSYLDMLDKGKIGRGDPAAVVADTYYGKFVSSLLEIQYRNRRRTLRDMLPSDTPTLLAASQTLESYLHAFDRFVVRRIPVCFENADVLSTLN